MGWLQNRTINAVNAYLATNSKAAAAMAFAFPAYATGRSGWGGLFSFAPRDFDYRAADPLSNSAAMACLNWIRRNFNQAPLEVFRKRGANERPVVGHPLTELLNNPNPFYSSRKLWAATLISYYLDGNAYWWKLRKANGRGPTGGLLYLPHWCVEPKWSLDGSDFISHYEYLVNGNIKKLAVADVVHLRNGLDPYNQRKGLAPLNAVLREIFTDEEAANFSAALLKNMGIPGVVLSSGAATLSKEKAESIKQVYKQKFGGSNRGEPLILDFESTITTLGFNPKDMDYSAVRQIPEDRITACFGVAAISVGLSAARDASTYNNMRQADRRSFEQCLMPLWEEIADELTSQLLPEFDRQPRTRVMFDTSNVKALREAEDATQERLRKNFQAGAITLNEFRAGINEPADPNGDYYLRANSARAIAPERAALESGEAAPLPNALMLPPANQEPGENKGKSFKSVQWEGLTLRREPTGAELHAVKAVAAAQEKGKQDILLILQAAFEELTQEAIEALASLAVSDLPALVLSWPAEKWREIRDLLETIYTQGRQQITEELHAQNNAATSPGQITKAQGEALDAATDAIVSRVVNDTQARVINVASRQAMLGVTGAALGVAVAKALEILPTGFLSNTASEAANVSLAQGRKAEQEEQSGNIETYQYSALLDKNTCGPCFDADGLEAASMEELPQAPNPDCEGGALCRCFIVGIAK